MDDDDALGCLSAFLPFSLGRTLNAMIFTGFVSVIPAALVSGSGGSGNGFHETRFLAIVIAAVVAAGVLSAVLGELRRRRLDGPEPDDETAARRRGGADG